ncbi:ABC transporter permease [Bacillus sp. 31A1R]|uniref:ABC transporter permease n=1 Tax=Robertmurraya mangrovi TaxID=3098077 RepID=A0ABU5IWL7_9BACI|nr:ABC transporter permease [Bacillus sp. 31A1R]MDZ5471545.1 ABC transporter permease [Bacillus sp. 31A1R]
MKQNKTLIIGSVMVGLLLLITILGPYLPFVDADLKETKFFKTENGAVLPPPLPPSEEFILGTDRKGRDYLSILIIGAKETLVTILFLTFVCFSLGTLFGIFASKNKFTNTILVAWNQLFSRVPNLFVIILITNIPFFIFSPNRYYYFIALIAILEIGKIADIFKQQLDVYNKSAIVESGVVVGNSSFTMLKRYYLPHLTPQLILSFVLNFGKILFLVGQLGIFSIFLAQEFIQLPGAPGLPTSYQINNTSLIWTTHLSNIIRDINVAPWIPFGAAALITYTIMAFNLLGEGLRVYFQNRTKSSKKKIETKSTMVEAEEQKVVGL